jgi:hypothetical protein
MVGDVLHTRSVNWIAEAIARIDTREPRPELLAEALIERIDGLATIEELASWVYMQDRGTAITVHDCTRWLELRRAQQADGQEGGVCDE